LVVQPAKTRRQRHGLTLIEIMVAIALMATIAAIGVPAMSGLLDLKQRSAAKELAQTYTWLLDEAALRNVAFRMVYNLDRSTWTIEAGDPNTLVFTNPEKREEFDERIEDDMSRYTQREVDEGEAEDVESQRGRFTGLAELDVPFTTSKPLPNGTRFAYVYTPQYEEGGLEPTKEGPPEDVEDDQIAYTYVFPDGTAEHTVVRIVDEEDNENGWTIEVLPVSGEIRLSTDLVDPQDSLNWVPDEGPELR
jgi:prepilin-type N-terminal cleavage/methylation domain-containing protein